MCIKQTIIEIKHILVFKLKFNDETYLVTVLVYISDRPKFKYLPLIYLKIKYLFYFTNI